MRRILCCIMCAVLLCGCGGGNNTQESTSGRDENGNWIFEGVVTIGRVVPKTGPLSSFGVGTPYVEQAAINAINEKGGVLLDGKRCELELVYRDSRSDVEVAAECARELIEEGIDIMIVSNTADTVSPVSAVCEREGIPCISVDAPASAWSMGGPYKNSWHTFFDNEREMLSFLDAWNSIESNKKIGLITANDSEGVEISTFIHDFAVAKGYTLVDPGSYYIGEDDFSEKIAAFKEQDCDIILGVMNPVDFRTFWQQLMATDYRPEMCTVAKSCLFESDVTKLGAIGNGLISEVWWNKDFPFTSSITGWKCGEIAADYLKNCQPELSIVPPTVGYQHANVEILYDILKRAGSLDLDDINKAASETDLDTIVGHVSFNEDHVALMSCVTGQWVLNDDGTYRQEIVGNYLMPDVAITADIILIPDK